MQLLRLQVCRGGVPTRRRSVVQLMARCMRHQLFQRAMMLRLPTLIVRSSDRDLLVHGSQTVMLSRAQRTGSTTQAEATQHLSATPQALGTSRCFRTAVQSSRIESSVASANQYWSPRVIHNSVGNAAEPVFYPGVSMCGHGHQVVSNLMSQVYDRVGNLSM